MLSIIFEKVMLSDYADCGSVCANSFCENVLNINIRGDFESASESVLFRGVQNIVL